MKYYLGYPEDAPGPSAPREMIDLYRPLTVARLRTAIYQAEHNGEEAIRVADILLQHMGRHLLNTPSIFTYENLMPRHYTHQYKHGFNKWSNILVPKDFDQSYFGTCNVHISNCVAPHLGIALEEISYRGRL